MIVLDTTILIHAVGEPHALAGPARLLVRAIGDGRVHATTTVEVIQEFTHAYGRRRDRREAVRKAGEYADLLSPLLVVEPTDLGAGLRLFERHSELGAFGAVLAAVTLARVAEALVSAD
ncbi:MAG: PIN domain-containing protein, partial [Candidatus Limnocylindria bacterium]